LNNNYLDKILQFLDEQNHNYEVLSEMSITQFNDYKSYYILIEGSILYVVSMGEADGTKAGIFFKNLHDVAKFKKGEKLIFIMDATQLHNMPASARKEVDFFDIEFRRFWSKTLFIYDGIAKVILDMYEIHKPEHLEGLEKINSPEIAIQYAINGKMPEFSEDDYLNSLSRDELIAEVKKLSAPQRNNEYKETVDQSVKNLFNAITNISWGKEGEYALQFDKKDPLAAIYGILNTSLSDFRDLNHELAELKSKFYNDLQFKVGEVLHQEASLRAIFDSLDSIIWMVDNNYILMAFNKNFYSHLRSQYGITPEVGMNIIDQSELGDKYKVTLSRIAKALNGNEENYRDFYREKGEIVKVVDSKIFPVILNEHVSGAACLTNDITEKYAAEEQVKSNERIIASVNKNISEAIYRSSPEKGLIFVNQAFVKMFGFESKHELYNNLKLPLLYADPDDRERLGRYLIDKKEITNFEVQFRKKNGAVFTGLLSSMVSVGEDGVNYFDGAIRDVSVIKNAQEKLEKQNSELKKLNTELDSFVYSASHDLKAPLSSVKGLINLAKNEENREQLQQYLDLVDKSVGKLDDFIKDIVDLSRNARQDVEAEPIDFKEIVEDTLDNFQYLENFERISRVLKINSNVDFYSDKRRLKVLLNNLISNAIRYFNPYIDNPTVEIKIDVTLENAILTISDNGLGIENKYLDKIFEMFFRASNNSKGTGIGLYIVKETVNKIDGSIEVESEVEKGTTFKVTVPNLKH
jgi:PAS domain S-box-containing protein